MPKEKFSLRRFVSLLTFFSFIILAVSGVILFIEPPGRIAFWSGWSLGGMDKNAWDGLHIAGAIIFLTASLFHIYYNWTALKKYLARRRPLLSGEFWSALLICLIIFAGATLDLPPTASLANLSEHAKNGWNPEKYPEPPIGHAELLPLKDFCKKMQIDLDQALNILNKNSLKDVSPAITMGELAAANRLSPAAVYNLLAQPAGGNSSLPQDESGIGRLTFSETLEKYRLNEVRARQQLIQRGISADNSETLKEIAARHGQTPHEIISIMQER